MGKRHFQYGTSCNAARALDAARMTRGNELGIESGDQRLPSRLEPPV